MYRHFIVPVDQSALSAANVEAAVALARSLGARITFFHATQDLAATSDGALLHAMAPDAFRAASLGETHAVLAKAEASAAAANVRCSAAARTTSRPAESIVEEAKAAGCDLIVTASRGHRGWSDWLHTTQTERILRRSPIALLITRVGSNEPLTAQERALGVILDEHRSIAAVVRGMLDLSQTAAVGSPALDRHSLAAMLGYLQAFPLRLHHPKEEQFLHRCLRERSPESGALLEAIEHQHVREHALVAEAVARLAALAPDDDAGRQALADHLQTLAEAVWEHLALEEQTVLPHARRHLHEADWTEMAAAFEGNDDPGFGRWPQAEFRQLFTRIANLMHGEPEAI